MGGDGTVVFVGPSLDRDHLVRTLPAARIEPPACRGDIERHLDDGVRSFLLLDGAFAHRLAVSPAEIVCALAAGARIVGAASLGAIRAAECQASGMAGVGAVYRLYRLRVIADDDEVAVAMQPDAGFRATSVALINVRYAAIRGLRRRLLDRDAANALLRAAKAMHFSQRHWSAIFAAARVDADSAVAELCRATDIKRDDATAAIAHVAGLAPARQAARRRPAAPPVRYGGHDPQLGLTRDALQAAVIRWLMASGRYRRYVGDARAGVAMEALWTELDRQCERQAEIMRWYAVRRGASLTPSTDGEPLAPWLAGARAELAREHGLAGWIGLEAALRRARMPDGVPVAWAREAAHQLALARRNLGRACLALPAADFSTLPAGVLADSDEAIQPR
jgi:hypothetical protein